jgi:hypothetical protein
MNRSGFLKELGGSLFETVKTVYEPFIHGDFEKVEEAADRALGITWRPLMKKYGVSSELEMKYIDGKPIIVSGYGTKIRALDGVCPVCSNIIIVTALYSSGKCLNCQKEFNFKTQSGELLLLSYPIKVKDDVYYIGFQRNQRK